MQMANKIADAILITASIFGIATAIWWFATL